MPLNSLARMLPIKSRSWLRCMMIMNMPALGSFSRVGSTSSHTRSVSQDFKLARRRGTLQEGHASDGIVRPWSRNPSQCLSDRIDLVIMQTMRKRQDLGPQIVEPWRMPWQEHPAGFDLGRLGSHADDLVGHRPYRNSPNAVFFKVLNEARA